MNARLRLMADDLSGALDTIVGLRLPAMDWPAIVTWKIELEQCVAISTDTRDGSDNNPALVIKQEDGDEVLKLASEVKSA
jgi:hypothetical protein